MKCIPRQLYLLVIPLLLSAESTFAQGGGRMRVLVPAFAGVDRASSRTGERLAERLRDEISALATHVSIEPRDVRNALERVGAREADMNCVAWRQLGQRLQAGLVLCGTVSAAGEVRASFVSTESTATFDVPVFTAQDEREGARRIVGAFGEFVEQISIAYYCAEAIGSESWQQAVERCTDAVNRNATMIAPRYHLASALIRLDRVEEALRAYERVIELDPMHAEALLGAGVAAARLGQRDVSMRHLEEYLQLNPGDEQVRLSVATRLANEGDPEAALRLTQVALQKEGATAAAYQYAGHFAFAASSKRPAGDGEVERRRLLEAALEYYAQAERRGGQADATSLRSAMSALQQLGRTAEAVAAGERATQLLGQDAAIWSAYADALRAAGRARDALVALDRVTELAPDHPRLGARRALLLIELGQPQPAVTAARQSLDRGEISAADVESIAQTFVLYVTRMNPLDHDVALAYLTAARQLGRSERTIGMINHVHGFVLYRRGEQLAKPNNAVSAAAALPIFQMALNMFESAGGYPDQAEARRTYVNATRQQIEIQQALIRARR